MAEPLADCWAKFKRAKYHLELLNDEISFWMKFKAPTASIDFGKEFNPRTNRFRYYMRNIAPLPLDVGLIIGDSVNNFRASLDYLANILVERGRTPVPPKPRDVEFPIQSTHAGYTANFRRNLPGVRRKHLALVRQCQPYLRGKRAHLHPLAILANLSNQDKHRKLQTTFSRVFQFSGTVREQVNFRITKMRWRKVLSADVAQGNTEFVRFWGIPTGTGKPDVKMNFTSSFTITFADGIRVDRALTNISNSILRILKTFEPIL